MMPASDADNTAALPHRLFKNQDRIQAAFNQVVVCSQLYSQHRWPKSWFSGVSAVVTPLGCMGSIRNPEVTSPAGGGCRYYRHPWLHGPGSFETSDFGELSPLPGRMATARGGCTVPSPSPLTTHRRLDHYACGSQGATPVVTPSKRPPGTLFRQSRPNPCPNQKSHQTGVFAGLIAASRKRA